MPHLPVILQKSDSTKPLLKGLDCPYAVDVPCSPVDRYRTFDGRCNNLIKPLWGSSNQPLARFLAPDYADGKTFNIKQRDNI